MHRAKEDFISRLKNYSNNKIIIDRTLRTDKLQQVIETFEKKRKDTLNIYWRKWRRN